MERRGRGRPVQFSYTVNGMCTYTKRQLLNSKPWCSKSITLWWELQIFLLLGLFHLAQSPFIYAYNWSVVFIFSHGILLNIFFHKKPKEVISSNFLLNLKQAYKGETQLNWTGFSKKYVKKTDATFFTDRLFVKHLFMTLMQNSFDKQFYVS